MNIVCISKKVTGGGLTFGKKYEVIKVIKRGDYYNSSFLLINDNGIEMWYGKCPYGVIEVIYLNGDSIKYIGEPSTSLTYGKCYEVLDKEVDQQYFNFINDDNQFVGISKISYLGGKENFIEITKERDNKIKQILE